MKRLEFLDLAKDVPDGGELDATEQFEIDFTVMTGELARGRWRISPVRSAVKWRWTWLIGKKSPTALFADISFVSGGQRRDFARLP